MVLKWGQNKLQANTPKACEEQSHICYIFYRIGMAVKNGQIGYNESTFLPIFYAYTFGFSVATYKQNQNWKLSLRKMCHMLPKVQSK